MKNGKLIFSLFVSLFVALCVALPGVALADSVPETVTLTQEMFDAAGGTYTITEADKSYCLASDVTGSLYINAFNISDYTDIDLGGHTLTSKGNQPVVSIGNVSKVRIHDGVLCQETSGVQAVNFYNNASLLLRNVSASAINANCIEVKPYGDVIIRGDDSNVYKTTITSSDAADAAVLAVGSGGFIFVGEGNFVLEGGDTIVSNQAASGGQSSVMLSGNVDSGPDFSVFPEQAEVSSGSAMVAIAGDGTTPSYFEVVNSYYAARKASCYVETGISGIGKLYFQSVGEAVKWAKDRDIADSDIHAKFTVKFDSAGGTPTYDDLQVGYEDHIESPGTPSRDGYEFVSWTYGGYSWNFNYRGVTSDMTLVAEWKPLVAVAQVEGGKQYASLQDAIDAAGSGATVTLLMDTEEQVTIGGEKNLTIDLGGHTLSHTGEGALISVRDSAKVTLRNGSFACDDACVSVADSGELSILTGTYSDCGAGAYVVEGACMYKSADGSFEVVAADEAKQTAAYVVTVAGDAPDGFKVYFESEADARDAQAGFEKATLAKIHLVKFWEDGSQVDLRYLEDGEALGELPEAKQFDGYAFFGWFVGDDRAEEATAFCYADDREINVIAYWVWDGDYDYGDDDDDLEPTDSPEPADNQAGSDAQTTPKTGEAANIAGPLAVVGAALMAAGVSRRRRA